MELTQEEKADLYMAVITRMSRIVELLQTAGHKDSKEYQDEYGRMIILKHKIYETN